MARRNHSVHIFVIAVSKPDRAPPIRPRSLDSWRYRVGICSLVGLLAVLAVGCSRMTPEEEAEVRQSFGVPADMPMKDLGEVKLRAGIPKRVRLGPGKDCTITAAVLTNGLVQLDLLYEFKGEVIEGVKAPPHSERSQTAFRPRMVEGWHLCLFPKGRRLAVALRPVILP